MALAEEQIKTAFEQSEKEVNDLHARISQGIREVQRNGTKVGISKGTKLTTDKSIKCNEIIKKHSKDEPVRLKLVFVYNFITFNRFICS